ncbi:MAG TPA: hypothetical protein VLQ89_00740, partial [Candidatus Binatia bacterium]|nr:hypothetical protein [Candidatus Binatia bacterium]
MPAGADAAGFMRDQLAEMNNRLLFLTAREGGLAPLQTKRAYDRYGHYQIPRIRGTFLLHQLRLALGNDAFSRFMKDVHARFRNRAISNPQFMALLRNASPALTDVADQWLARPDLPQPRLKAGCRPDGERWKVTLEIEQPQTAPFRFWTSVCLQTEKKSFWKLIEVRGGRQTIEFILAEKPRRLVFNAGNDIPV